VIDAPKGPPAPAPWRLRDWLLLAAVLIAGGLAVHGAALELERGARQGELLESAATLERALLSYNREHGSFPPSAEPAGEAFRPDTLEPLVRDGLLWEPAAVTAALDGGRVAAYQSPDRPARDADYWALLVHAEDPTVQCLVADTDEFPGRLGERLRGTYLIEGTRLKAARP
jgi:hypothetical protein